MSQQFRHEASAARGLRFRFVDELPTRRGYDEDEVLPAATLLRLPPRGAYVAPGAKTSGNMPCLQFDLSLCSVRHLARCYVCVRNLTADIFYWGLGFRPRGTAHQRDAVSPSIEILD
ncbi:MAG: hypothetical protein J0H52_02520, partial [Comamonadaceae bacterium]|nr:hypothetical protein [Comamonadaceae bacterium]